MAMLIYDPTIEEQIRADLEAANPARCNEIWEGMEVVAPLANNEHTQLAFKLAAAFSAVIDWDRGDRALTACNVSDRDEGWKENFRNPDALVVLAGGRAVDNDTHWTGGPDLVVEIISPGEDPLAKFAFYAGIGTREVLIVDRYPWSMELYHLQSGQLVLSGRSDEANLTTVASAVLPLTFRLEAATPRPRIVVMHSVTGQTWLA